jgi:hypothetical protein
MTRVLLRCVDLETTGLAPPECVIELGWSAARAELDRRRAV